MLLFQALSDTLFGTNTAAVQLPAPHSRTDEAVPLAGHQRPGWDAEPQRGPSRQPGASRLRYQRCWGRGSRARRPASTPGGNEGERSPTAKPAPLPGRRRASPRRLWDGRFGVPGPEPQSRNEHSPARLPPGTQRQSSSSRSGCPGNPR